jgi:hypothetical protein
MSRMRRTGEFKWGEAEQHSADLGHRARHPAGNRRHDRRLRYSTGIMLTTSNLSVPRRDVPAYGDGGTRGSVSANPWPDSGVQSFPIPRDRAASDRSFRRGREHRWTG